MPVPAARHRIFPIVIYLLSESSSKAEKEINKNVKDFSKMHNETFAYGSPIFNVNVFLYSFGIAIATDTEPVAPARSQYAICATVTKSYSLDPHTSDRIWPTQHTLTRKARAPQIKFESSCRAHTATIWNPVPGCACISFVLAPKHGDLQTCLQKRAGKRKR